ncbi:hypothetical protein SAMN04488132_10337 [Sediminibacterium ginsengisoli]|uniref:Uncharacterized protein n=1 Tax=Sediminibacterium ginsengisoli TaxID=413434 RepID=A0A1T4LX75_9BACT|nr:hypothetical protein SAMN04488132_10337 [Sediminibacterium ginsengisoli]
MKNVVTFVLSLFALVSLMIYAWWPESGSKAGHAE